MLMTREQIRQDTFFEGLTEAILERDQPRTTDLYFQMVARQRRSVYLFPGVSAGRRLRYPWPKSAC